MLLFGRPNLFLILRSVIKGPLSYTLQCVDGINDKHILEPKCDFDYINQQQLFGKRRSLDDIFRKPNKGFSCRVSTLVFVSFAYMNRNAWRIKQIRISKIHG